MTIKSLAFIATVALIFFGCEKDNYLNDDASASQTEETSELLTKASRPYFNKSKDLLLAQFDGKPDADDIHSVAALGCMLLHNDLKGIKYLAVQGAYGTQGGKFIEAGSLYNKAFGSNWVDAHANWNQAVTKIKNAVRPILNAGGKVWVQEAGQSTITKQWVNQLLSEGMPAWKIKQRVIVVQHSVWNEDHTSQNDLAYVKNKTKYQAIDNGNYSASSDRGPDTPSYNSKTKSFLTDAIKSSNPNAKARNLWVTAKNIITASGFNASYSNITKGGVDFSDCVENYWIFNTTQANNITNFWKRYVTNRS